MRALRFAVSLAAMAFLAGCAGLSGDGSGSFRGLTHDPLIDAPYRAEMSCTSQTPVTVLKHVGEVPFACPDLGVSATIDEIRDAGWRIVSLDIGEDEEKDNHVGFPVTIQVRKIYMPD